MNDSDWKAVAGELLAEQRQRVGEPPEIERVQAYLAGRLPEAEAEEVRQALACYPELALALAEPSSAAGERVLTEEQLAEDWTKLQARVGMTKLPDKVVEFPRPSAVERLLPI